MSNNHAAHDEHRPNVAMYVKVFGALMVLTLVTVAISKIDMARPLAIGLGLFVACVKASLVGALFMHLWGEHKLIHKTLYITVVCALILLLPLIDCVMISHRITAPIAVADQHPGGHGGTQETHTETLEVPGTVTPPGKKAH